MDVHPVSSGTVVHSISNMIGALVPVSEATFL